jgi:hypothetical protein
VFFLLSLGDVFDLLRLLDRTIAVPSAKPVRLTYSIVNKYREGKVKRTPFRGVK